MWISCWVGKKWPFIQIFTVLNSLFWSFKLALAEKNVFPGGLHKQFLKKHSQNDWNFFLRALHDSFWICIWKKHLIWFMLLYLKCGWMEKNNLEFVKYWKHKIIKRLNYRIKSLIWNILNVDIFFLAFPWSGEWSEWCFTAPTW